MVKGVSRRSPLSVKAKVAASAHVIAYPELASKAEDRYSDLLASELKRSKCLTLQSLLALGDLGEVAIRILIDARQLHLSLRMSTA